MAHICNGLHNSACIVSYCTLHLGKLLHIYIVSLWLAWFSFLPYNPSWCVLYIAIAQRAVKCTDVLFLSAGFWWSRVFEIPRSSNRAGLCVSKHNLSSSQCSLFVLIPPWNVNYAPGIIRFSLRCFSVKSHSSSTTPSQYHQSAAKDLTSTTEPASSSSSPTQTTYLTSSMQQRSKRPRNFLELKNFKDNYNTLDSSFWKRKVKAKVELPVIKVPTDADGSPNSLVWNEKNTAFIY